jgi:hypothetical protein
MASGGQFILLLIFSFPAGTPKEGVKNPEPVNITAKRETIQTYLTLILTGFSSFCLNRGFILSSYSCFCIGLKIMIQQQVVTPAKAGVQMTDNCIKILDSGFRRNDLLWVSATFYKCIKNNSVSYFYMKNG